MRRSELRASPASFPLNRLKPDLAPVCTALLPHERCLKVAALLQYARHYATNQH
jgi:hypothetical protein